MRVSANGEVSGPPQELKVPEALTESESGQAAARSYALKSPFQRCAEQYNTVVLQSDSAAPANWMFYLVPATEDPDRIPLGGAHRFEMRFHGTELDQRTRFHPLVRGVGRS